MPRLIVVHDSTEFEKAVSKAKTNDAICYCRKAKNCQSCSQFQICKETFFGDDYNNMIEIKDLEANNE